MLRLINYHPLIHRLAFPTIKSDRTDQSSLISSQTLRHQFRIQLAGQSEHRTSIAQTSHCNIPANHWSPSFLQPCLKYQFATSKKNKKYRIRDVGKAVVDLNNLLAPQQQPESQSVHHETSNIKGQSDNNNKNSNGTIKPLKTNLITQVPIESLNTMTFEQLCSLPSQQLNNLKTEILKTKLNRNDDIFVKQTQQQQGNKDSERYDSNRDGKNCKQSYETQDSQQSSKTQSKGRDKFIALHQKNLRIISQYIEKYPLKGSLLQNYYMLLGMNPLKDSQNKSVAPRITNNIYPMDFYEDTNIFKVCRMLMESLLNPEKNNITIRETQLTKRIDSQLQREEDQEQQDNQQLLSENYKQSQLAVRNQQVLKSNIRQSNSNTSIKTINDTQVPSNSTTIPLTPTPWLIQPNLIKKLVAIRRQLLLIGVKFNQNLLSAFNTFQEKNKNNQQLWKNDNKQSYQNNNTIQYQFDILSLQHQFWLGINPNRAKNHQSNIIQHVKYIENPLPSSQRVIMSSQRDKQINSKSINHTGINSQTINNSNKAEQSIKSYQSIKSEQFMKSDQSMKSAKNGNSEVKITYLINKRPTIDSIPHFTSQLLVRLRHFPNVTVRIEFEGPNGREEWLPGKYRIIDYCAIMQDNPIVKGVLSGL